MIAWARGRSSQQAFEEPIVIMAIFAQAGRQLRVEDRWGEGGMRKRPLETAPFLVVSLDVSFQVSLGSAMFFCFLNTVKLLRFEEKSSLSSCYQ